VVNEVGAAGKSATASHSGAGGPPGAVREAPEAAAVGGAAVGGAVEQGEVRSAAVGVAVELREVPSPQESGRGGMDRGHAEAAPPPLVLADPPLPSRLGAQTGSGKAALPGQHASPCGLYMTIESEYR